MTRTSASARLRHRALAAAVAASAVFGLGGCATRSADVQPLATDPAQFRGWTCRRIHDETDLVQRRAAEVAWDVDERAGNNIFALGLGVTVFWPALLAMRPDGAEAATLARLKGRFEALQTAAAAQGCPPPADRLPPDRAAALPVRPGERLVYEQRGGVRDPLQEVTLTITTLRRNEFEFALESDESRGVWRQDLLGNVVEAPAGALLWRRLLRDSMSLGDVVYGEIVQSGQAEPRARVRGQVVAQGPQRIAGRAFDAQVIELFGDVKQGDAFTRLEGAMVVDRASGVLLRLDLRSASPTFRLQRRLVRVDAPAG